MQQIFSALELRTPCQGEWMWRIPGYFTINDVENLLEKLKLGLESGIVENDTKGSGLFNFRIRENTQMEREEDKEDNLDDFNYEENQQGDDKNEKENVEEDANLKDFNENDQNNMTDNEGQKNNNDQEENLSENGQKNNNDQEENLSENGDIEEERKIIDDDEGENFFDVNDEGNKEKKNDIKWEATLPLATLENYEEEENEKRKILESKNKWVEQTLVVPTLNPEDN